MKETFKEMGQEIKLRCLQKDLGTNQIPRKINLSHEVEHLDMKAQK